MEIKQSFLKGINRSISRDEFFNPEFFWSTQNARILQSGNIGEVVRIKGYNQISSELSDLDTLYDIVLVNNSAVGTVNNYTVFYKDTSGDFRIKIFDDSGTLQDSFSYSSNIDLEYGELKQHSNSIFVAPHNKILYGIDGNFFLKDFISQIPKIKQITRESLLEQNAKYDLTVNETLSGGYAGSKAIGYISVSNISSIPSTVEESFYVKIGDNTSDIVGPFTNYNAEQLVKEIVDTINSSTDLSDWTASKLSYNPNRIKIENNTIGSAPNGTTIDITEANIATSMSMEEHIKVMGTVTPGSSNTPTFITHKVKGGVDQGSVYGAARISIKDAIVTSPIQINDTDTTSDIAEKFRDILASSVDVTNQYNISRSTNTVTVEAKFDGKEYNTNIVITINETGGNVIEVTDNFVTLTQTREGRDSTTTGTIKPFTNYWYKARLRFRDGHITRTCPAKLINSKAVQPINIAFDIPTDDLDDTHPRLQIFRKEESRDFHLIEEVNLDDETVTNGEFIYIDDGLSEIEPLKEVSNVWTKSHNNEEIIDNRLVKAHIEFFDEQYDADSSDFTLSVGDVEEGNDDVAPYNSKASLYVKPQYDDGTLGYHRKIGSIDIEGENKKIGVQQTSLISNTEKNVSELKFYGRFLPFGQKQNVRFGTAEIISPFLSAIEDPFLYSDVTKVLFGFKYVMKIGDYIYTRVEGWSDESDQKILAKVGTNEARLVDNKLILTVFGEEFTYIPVAVYSEDTVGTQYIYKLEMFEALQNAISTGSLNLQLKRPAKDGMSSKISDDVLTQLQVNVVGLDDKTGGIEKFSIEDIPVAGFLEQLDFNCLLPPEDNRLYLVLEESKLDEIDNDKINRRGYKSDDEFEEDFFTVLEYPKIDLIESGTVAFELLNFQEKTGADFDINNTSKHYTDVDEFDVINLPDSKEAVYYLINRQLTFEDNVIYLGSKDNEVDASTHFLDTTGFNHKPRSNLFYSVLSAYNIYETLTQESDFNVDDNKFETQILWSNPLLDNNYYSGGRNFAVTNYYNLPTENGNIINMISLNGNLYVFCEKGVAKLLVGETLTQQKSGQVYIDSAGFITKHIWLLEDLADIKVNSIVKIDNMLFFTDGVNVYKISEQGLENISLGNINVQEDVDYEGSISKSFNEYRLGNPSTGETFVYNTKYQQWYGPFTYVPSKSIEVNGKIISYVNGLVEENVGNTFNGSNYDTLIQSVGDDTEVGHYMKTFRRFYIGVENVTGSTLEYGKDYNNLISKNFDNLREENGQYVVGIDNTEGNTRKIYWDITSNNDGFSLKSFNTLYDIRRRR